MQPIKIYNAEPGSGPNPWKTVLVVEELGIPYETVWVSYGDLKSEPYVSLNPNGRVPAMVDPNTDVTLFESGAIISYLVDTYDKDFTLTYGPDRLADRWLVQSWLHFQMSGQGPMFGQKMWFTHFHIEENVKSALGRYATEAKRIVGVIDASLRKQRQKQQLPASGPVWLVGEHCTLADLAFFTWDLTLFAGALLPENPIDVEKDFPEFAAWHGNVARRPAAEKVVAMRQEALSTKRNTAATVIEAQADGRKLS
ncbi:Uu.00g101560.m01.CDS01 [Anthostomella pinea]|uniref:Uu.00g101560.m01.CDS01 n=1 Tax=Anthostomella pinea TaxID=933095 RepID=A0AAI8VD95_9PEZI|nr:Uu.00g101560.m01.CDS01 [Anthostomella pinea]